MPTSFQTTDRPRNWRRPPARPVRPHRGDRPRRQQARLAAARGDVPAVLFVGTACGIYFGLTCGWQIAVESAQAVAGAVRYPPGNPFYMYHVKAWTLLHQLPALLLNCGVSESTLSMLIACISASLFLQALGLLCYAFCRDRWVACAVPMVYLATNVCKGCGAVYPLFIIPDEYWTSYGVTGSACALLAWSLWGVGWRRSAALLSGLSPAVHPALGGWCVAIAALAILWDWRAQRCRLGPVGRWFSAGVALAAVSYLVQQVIARGLPAADPVLSRRLLESFVEGWDNHRVPFPLGSVDCQYGWCMFALTAATQAWFAHKLPSESRLLLRVLLIMTSGSLALCALTHLSHWLPLAVMMAMPGRFINLAILAYPAVLIGLLVRGRRRWLVGCLLSGLALFCLLRTLMLSKQWIYVPTAYKVFIAVGLMFVYLLASPSPTASDTRVRRFTRAGVLACLASAGYLWMRDLHLAVLVWMAAVFLGVFSRRTFFTAAVLAFCRPVLCSVGDWLAVHRCLQIITISCLWLAFFIKGGLLFGLGCLIALACTRLARPVGWALPARKRHRADFRFSAAMAKARRVSVPLAREPADAGTSETLILRWRKNFHPLRDGLGRPSSARVLTCLAMMATSLGLIAVPLIERAKAGTEFFRKAETDPVITAARREPGMLLVVPRMCLVQLRTRRPVLLNGEAMNQITYVPQSGPAMNEIVKGVYGDDILKPRPAWWQNWGGLMMHSGYDLWQGREPAEWRRLSREFGFTQIVTGPEWKLQLPVVARSQTLVLYAVQ